MHSETPKLQPIVPTYHLRILTDEQLAQLKSATLELLEEVGIHCPSEKARAIYAAHGAQVDCESQIVKLPPDVVLHAMSRAPRFYTMGARSPDYDLKLDDTATEKTAMVAMKMVKEVLGTLTGGDDDPPYLEVVNDDDEGCS